MATTAADAVFLDTNSLVEAHDPSAPWHHDAVAALRRFAAAGVAQWVSRQVLREYLVTVTRPQPLQPPGGLGAEASHTPRELDVRNERKYIKTNFMKLVYRGFSLCMYDAEHL